jgi:hypothetical protein
MYTLREIHFEAMQMVFSAIAETNDKDKQKRLRALRDELVRIKYPETPL